MSQVMCYTDYVKKRNVTLTLEADLLRAARKAALDRNTSVNQMIRDYLMVVVKGASQQQTAMVNLEDIFNTYRVTVGDKTWSRDDLHER